MNGYTRTVKNLYYSAEKIARTEDTVNCMIDILKTNFVNYQSIIRTRAPTQSHFRLNINLRKTLYQVYSPEILNVSLRGIHAY